jgi:hypothetical protein
MYDPLGQFVEAAGASVVATVVDGLVATVVDGVVVAVVGGLVATVVSRRALVVGGLGGLVGSVVSSRAVAGATVVRTTVVVVTAAVVVVAGSVVVVTGAVVVVTARVVGVASAPRAEFALEPTKMLPWSVVVNGEARIPRAKRAPKTPIGIWATKGSRRNHAQILPSTRCPHRRPRVISVRTIWPRR